jgi:hypothetical protein
VKDLVPPRRSKFLQNHTIPFFLGSGSGALPFLKPANGSLPLNSVQGIPNSHRLHADAFRRTTLQRDNVASPSGFPVRRRASTARENVETHCQPLLSESIWVELWPTSTHDD